MTDTNSPTPNQGELEQQICNACGHLRSLHYSEKTGWGCTYSGCNRPDCFSAPDVPEGELCKAAVYWWEGEYEGECVLPKGHLEPFHYDGLSYYDNDSNHRDIEQGRLSTLITAQVQAAEARGRRAGLEAFKARFTHHWMAVNSEEGDWIDDRLAALQDSTGEGKK